MHVAPSIYDVRSRANQRGQEVSAENDDGWRFAIIVVRACNPAPAAGERLPALYCTLLVSFCPVGGVVQSTASHVREGWPLNKSQLKTAVLYSRLAPHRPPIFLQRRKEIKFTSNGSDERVNNKKTAGILQLTHFR